MARLLGPPDPVPLGGGVRFLGPPVRVPPPQFPQVGIEPPGGIVPHPGFGPPVFRGGPLLSPAYGRPAFPISRRRKRAALLTAAQYGYPYR